MTPLSYRCLSLSAATLLLATPAWAKPEAHRGSNHNQIEGVRFDVHATLDPYTGLGGGARIEFAIVPNGLVRGNVKDELALSFGGDVLVAPVYSGWYGYDRSAYALPIGAVQWNFYLGEKWSVFPEVGVAVRITFDRDGWSNPKGRDYGWVYPQPHVGIGARYHFSPNAALLLRASTPSGLQVGLVF